VEVDFARRHLVVHGQPVAIGERAFDILELLLRAGGGLVSKDDILASVWPGRFVGDNTLEVHISSLRRALGEHRGLLKTAYGRGYRLLGAWDLQGSGHSPQRQDTSIHPMPGAGRTNLPVLSSLIGRDEAATDVVSLLRNRRFLTLVGTGGIGKTRLAIEVGRRVLPDFEDGVWLIELGPLSEPSLVPGAVAAALGLDIAGSASPFDLITRALRTRRLLLILDTCEHLVDSAAQLAESILRTSGGIRILATSREPLRAQGEHLYSVQPLSVPAEDIPSGQIANHSSVQLFLARATAAEPDFPTDESSLATCGVFCRQLDGIPLAIELAAARAATLGMEVLVGRLEDRLRILGRGLRTALPRHQTLRAALDWSFELLNEGEQAVLRRLSIFAGSFDIDAATCVAPSAHTDAGEVVGHVAELVTKSLLVSESEGSARRFRLLDTTRAYAAEKLGTGPERQAAAHRHARYFRDLLEQAEAEWGLRPALQWLATYARCIDDVRTALDWAFSPGGDAAIGAELAVLSAPLWFQLSLAKAGTARFESALASIEASPLADDLLDRRARMQLNTALGWLGMFQSEAVARRGKAWATTLELARSLGDVPYEVLGLWSLCYSHLADGEFAKMWPLAHAFRDAALKSSDPLDLARADRTIAYLEYLAGRQPEARATLARLLHQPECRVGAPRVARYQFDHRAAVRMTYARVLWLQGFADQALVDVEGNVKETAEIVHLPSFWTILCDAALTISFLAGKLEAVERYSALLRPHMADDRMIVWQGFVEWLDGVMAIKRGDVEAGLPPMREGLAQRRLPGRRWPLVFMLGQTAEALTWAGRADEAMSAIDEGLELIESVRAQWYLPEFLRVKGEILQMQGQPPHAAEKCFEEAIALARTQGALAWELRAASSLARHHQREGRVKAALDVLTPVYGRFTEGLATSDLQQARALLEALRH
jgi:predicted ATPase/DNA-binding winged helix-turn-helix (wHTH) protein